VIEGEGIVKSMMECSKVVEQARREGRIIQNLWFLPYSFTMFIGNPFWNLPVKLPAQRAGLLKNLIKITWGNLSPKPPKKDAIHPRAKHGAFWHELVKPGVT
jgi:hypothetical protein